MCGQFHINYADVEKLEHINILRYPTKEEIHPTDSSLVIFLYNNEKTGDLFQFGIQSRYLFINIKSETILSKFSDWITYRRCIIPVSYYYEWDASKTKITFSSDSLLYMAGVYHNKQFAILTTEANDSIKPFHNRMPLILDASEIDTWLYDREKTFQLLHKIPKDLKNNRRFEQLSLF
ncbi:MAG: SOS response-associated peptidase family protein [Holdemanella sp.]|nr:SOS response-associated peptidase family protein [Holdemanella sp.]